MEQSTIYRIAGFFRGGKFSRIALIQLFEGGNSHESRQEHTVPNAFSKYFEGKIFTNGYRFMKFVKIFPLEKTPLYGTYVYLLPSMHNLHLLDRAGTFVSILL